MTSRSAVWVSEKLATLLSTSPASLAAAMTSTSRSVAERPLRDTDPDRSGLAQMLPESTEHGKFLDGVGREQDEVSLVTRPQPDDVLGPIGQLLNEGGVELADDGDACTRQDAQLVQQWGRIDAIGHDPTVAPGSARRLV